MRILERKHLIEFWLIMSLVFGAALILRSFCSPLDPRIVQADNEFAFKLFREMTKGGSKNLLISPVSVVLPMHMTYNGAVGETRQAMAKTLCLQGMTLDEVNRGNAGLLSHVSHSGRGVKVSVADSLWANKGVHFRPQFMKTNEHFYQAEETTLDFNDPGSISSINSWVKRRTGGKIDRVVDSLDPEAALLLINATYFKGEWTSKFDESLTDEMPFYLPDGRQKLVPMMYQKGTFVCSQSDWPQMIRLPYGNGQISMYVMLTGGDISHLRNYLNSASWKERLSSLRETQDVEVYFPRFKIRGSIDIKSSLSMLGMGIAFDPARANLSGICSPPAWISRVEHIAVIEVDEEGTEAAAATKAEVAFGSHRFIINRPFFFVIRDDRTGLILFMGWVADPTEGMESSDQLH